MTPQPADASQLQADGPHPATENGAAASPKENGTPVPFPKSSPSPGSSRLPRAKKLSTGSTVFIALAVVLGLGGVGMTGWYLFAGSSSKRADLLTQSVGRENLQITITERGALESAE